MEEYQEYFDRKFMEMEENNKKRNHVLVTKVNEFTEGLKKLAKRQDALAEENEVLRFEIQRLRNDLNFEQGKDRAANLIVRNCNTKDDLEETMRNRVLEVLREAKVSIGSEDIIAVSRLRKTTPERTTTLPIKVRLLEPSLKKLIFPVAKQIRLKHKICIDNDYTPPQLNELYKVRCTRRTLLQNGIDCIAKGFNILINGQTYNWQAALRLSQRMKVQLPLQSQTQMKDDTFPTNTDQNKRKANEISPQERQFRKQTLNNKNELVRPSQFTRQQSMEDHSFTQLFDNIA